MDRGDRAGLPAGDAAVTRAAAMIRRHDAHEHATLHDLDDPELEPSEGRGERKPAEQHQRQDDERLEQRAERDRVHK